MIVVILIVFCALQALNFRSLYRHDVEIAPVRRHMIFALQAVIISFAMIPALDPRFTMSCTRTRPSTVAVVLDDSFSMRKNHDIGALTNDLAVFLAARDRPAAVYDADMFVRDHRVPVFLRGSDHRALFSFLAAERPSAAVIISDGEGMHAADGGLTNIIAVMPEKRATLAVTGQLPKKLTEGEHAELSYTVVYRGASIPVMFTLREDGAIVRTIPLRLSGETNVRLSIGYRPRRIGDVLLAASVSGMAGDTSLDNERRDIVVVDREQTKVLLIGGAPSKDTGMLRTFLAGDVSIRLAAPEDTGGEPDIIFAVNPTAERISASRSVLERALARGVPFIIIYSASVGAIDGYSGLFPNVTRRPGKISLSADTSLITRLGTTDAENEARWRSMSMFDDLYIPDRELTAHVTANGFPAVASAYAAKSKVVYIGASPLWRLKMYGSVIGLSGLYESLISTLMHELTRPSYGSMFVDERTIDAGASLRVHFRSKGVLSAFYAPGAVTNEMSSTGMEVRSGVTARCRVDTSSLMITCAEPGMCTLRFETGGTRQDIAIAVNPASGEIAGGASSMALFASNSGGSFYTALDPAIWRSIPRDTIREKHDVAVTVWRNWIFLVVFILLLALLWYLKRVSGLR